MATKDEVDALSTRMDVVEANDTLGSGSQFMARPNNITAMMVWGTSPAARGALAG